MADSALIIYFDLDNWEDPEWTISDALQKGWEIAAVIPHQGIPVPPTDPPDPSIRQTPGGYVVMTLPQPQATE